MRAVRRLASFLLLAVCVSAEVKTLTILHTNDLHSRLVPLENKRGGFAYLAAAIRRERANCKDCILLNAGDLQPWKARILLSVALAAGWTPNRIGDYLAG